MLKTIYCLLLCNVTIFYFYSISNIFLKFCKFKSEKINKIILGYSIFIVISYNLYFTLSINPFIIKIFFLVTALLLSINIKKYFESFFLTKKNYVLNLIILLFLLPTLIYGEQFYIFRGNYWDHFHKFS